MTKQRIILGLVGLLLLFGIGRFIVRNVQTRAELNRIATPENPELQDAGTRTLLARGTLFDSLQGGQPMQTRLNAIASLERLAAGGDNEVAFVQLMQMMKDPDTESVEAKTTPVRNAARDAVARVGVHYPELLLDGAKDPDRPIQDGSRVALRRIGAPLKEQMAARLGEPRLRAPLGDILASIGPETIPLIEPYLQPPLLKEGDAAAKVQLIETMGKFSVPEAVPPIVPFRDDPDPNVRRTVITSLSNIATPNATQVLIAALNDPETDSDARAAAAGALGVIASPEANAAMVRALSDYDLRVANAAAAGLRRSGDKAIPAISEAMNHPEPAIRTLAAESVGGTNSPALAQRAMNDPDPSVRAMGASSMGDIIIRSNQLRAERDKLEGNNPTRQEEAVRTLMTRGYLMEAVRGPGSARPNTVATIHRMADQVQEKTPKEAERLRKVADRVAAAPAEGSPILAVDRNAAMQPLLNALGDPDGRVASGATLSLARIGQPAVPALVARLNHPDETVAYRASQSLERMGRPAVEPLVAAARNGGEGARWVAITLGQIGDPRAVPALQELSQSSDPETAWAADVALAKVTHG